MSGSTAPGRRFAPATLGLLCAGALASLAGSAAAQVIEVGTDGSRSVYDRPMVFNANGAVPIEAPRPKTIKPPIAASDTRALSSAAERFELSPALVEAVAWRESRLRPKIVSRAGAIGEMQLMPGTARDLGVDPFDTAQNYQGGADYLKRLLRRYDGDLLRTLAAYNAGPAVVDRYNGPPPYKETQAYVAAVMDRMSSRVSLAPEEKNAR